MKRMLLLPGSTGRFGSKRYSDAVDLILDEARSRGYEASVCDYPGQSGRESGLLSFDSAYEVAMRSIRAVHPHKLIARSFGCIIAAAVLASSQLEVGEVVMWGAYLGKTPLEMFRDRASRDKEIRDFENYGTYAAPDIFEATPGVEEFIGRVDADLCLTHGESDTMSTRPQLEELARTRREQMPGRKTVIRSVPGAKHTVVPSVPPNDPPEVVRQYLEALFEPI